VAVVVSPDTQTVFALDENVQFIASAVDARGTEIVGAEYTWASSNEDVATVDQNGAVTTVGAGSSMIEASLNAATGAAELWVDPDMVLKNHCDVCHTRGHASIFQTLSCPACHSMHLEWRDAEHRVVVDGHESASGGFDRRGAHDLAPCSACHDLGTGDAKFSPAGWDDCVTCHQGDYDAQHGGTSTPTTCLSCHSVDSWAGASSGHGSGGFSLLGAHQTIACTSCHDANDWTVLFNPADENDCIACHQSDYDNQHGSDGYPTTCLTCHTIDAFTGSTFNHDGSFFPISTGKHQGEWSGCATCHEVPTDFSVFTCFNCHKHNQSDMDDKHKEINGYGYNSNLCLACHPNGEAP
jgi:hypothetical protein